MALEPKLLSGQTATDKRAAIHIYGHCYPLPHMYMGIFDA